LCSLSVITWRNKQKPLPHHMGGVKPVKKAKTVKVKKSKERGEGVWLGTINGLGSKLRTPDTGIKMT
jgi:ribosomal protein L13E